MNDQQYIPCIVIPVYKHGKPLRGVVHTIRSTNRIPVILVDDGNDEVTKADITAVGQAHPGVSIVTLECNRGKGGAVTAGLLRAMELGFTHAFQIDADGQHDLEPLERFLEESRKHPHAMVGGAPVFDESVPSSRKNGRRITNFWVSVETLSRDIADAMCGYRVYPLANTLPLVVSGRLGRRMTFDIEILVRLHWRRVPLIFIPLRVVYPEGSVSNFRMVQDNLAITGMHTRLFFGMVLRLPVLVLRRMLSHGA